MPKYDDKWFWGRLITPKTVVIFMFHSALLKKISLTIYTFYPLQDDTQTEYGKVICVNDFSCNFPITILFQLIFKWNRTQQKFSLATLRIRMAFSFFFPVFIARSNLWSQWKFPSGGRLDGKRGKLVEMETNYGSWDSTKFKGKNELNFVW